MMRFRMFTQAATGRKIAINYKLVRSVHELSAIGEDKARSRIEMQPVHGAIDVPWVDVEEDFGVVCARLNILAK